MKDQPVAPKSDDKYEVECIARAIKDVEMAKKDKPELYDKALQSLKSEAKAIMSIDDLKARREELMKEEEPEAKEESSDEEEKDE